MNILFVCTGNTCRSPMAEALLKQKYPDTAVRSAGIFAGKNEPANPQAIQALAERGITLDHQTQPVDDKLLNWADVVLSMTTGHKQNLMTDYPAYQEKFFTLKEYVSSADNKVWEELRERYADLETKRALFVREHGQNMSMVELDKALRERFKAEMTAIEKLEMTLISYDISDPFGGDISVYEHTLNELDACMDHLMKKIQHQADQ
ncbi:Arsenate reductase (glutaredoxin) [Lentibacillus sp. JNUCC-1]|nr:low molecular weight protein arginine phosphatase [Lentibacillus sp. JNUCC-1]MUV37400.1 Arsenate reductase (glutaredoxin) [Lentibacillus sp. JNUCC-1]